eukprot:3983518-Pyramimonas_sp.AAC.2
MYLFICFSDRSWLGHAPVRTLPCVGLTAPNICPLRKTAATLGSIAPAPSDAPPAASASPAGREPGGSSSSSATWRSEGEVEVLGSLPLVPTPLVPDP